MSNHFIALSMHTCISGVKKFGTSREPTIKAVNDRVWRSKNRGDPHCRQKYRLDVGEDRYTSGWPLVTLTSFDGININAIKGAPEARWHMRQWQMALSAGVPLASYRIEPQR